jgi:predicted RND superfamily exporter protein
MLKSFLNYTMLVLLGITVWLAYSIKDTKFDYNFEHFFPVESDEASFYYDFRDRFGSDNEFILIGIQREKGIFDAEFLRGVDSLCTTLKSFENVRSVTSLTTFKMPIVNSFGIIEVPIVNLNNPENLQLDSTKIARMGNLVGSLISPDSKSIAIYVRHTDLLEKEKAENLLDRIEKSCSEIIKEKSFITGKLKSERAYLDKTKFELLLFMSLSFVLVTLFLWFTFRNFWGVMVPLTVVLLSIIWTIGIMAVTGKSIDIMIILMPCILFVVGMSDVIHITSQFYEKIEEGYEKAVAIRLSLEEVGFATFLTCISTSVAFLTLNTTSIQPIRDFGTYTAIGVVVAYILSITLLPFILMHVKNPDKFKVHVRQVKWDKFLRKLIKVVFRNPRKIIVGTLVIIAFAGVGINRIEINNSVLDDLDENDPIKQEFRFFDANFSGVRGFEMSITSKKKGEILSWESLQEIMKLEEYLSSDYHVGAIVSPIGLLKGFNQAVHDGDPNWYRLPINREENELLVSQLKPLTKRKEIKQLLREDLSEARISGRIRDKGSKAVGFRNAGLEEFIANQNFKNIETRLTGSSDLIDKSNEYLTDNMLQGLSLDIFALMLIIAIIFRSWRMMLISVLPNIIPLAMIAGYMGWANIEMKVTISIIFSIAFGIAVDDTLHLLSRLKVELDKGFKLHKALMITYLSTGKAMILTAMVIASGFSTLMLSNFKSTFYVGLLISLTLLFALIAELILMPVLIMWIYGRKKIGNEIIVQDSEDISP